MNVPMAQRFFNLVLLPRVRDDIQYYKRLNFHLFAVSFKVDSSQLFSFWQAAEVVAEEVFIHRLIYRYNAKPCRFRSPII